MNYNKYMCNNENTAQTGGLPTNNVKNSINIEELIKMRDAKKNI